MSEYLYEVARILVNVTDRLEAPFLYQPVEDDDPSTTSSAADQRLADDWIDVFLEPLDPDRRAAFDCKVCFLVCYIHMSLSIH